MAQQAPLSIEARGLVAGIGILCLGLTQAGAARFTPRDPDLIRGIDQVKSGDFDSGLASLELAVQKLSLEPRSVKELAWAFVYRGVARLERDEQALAVQDFREGLSRDPLLQMDPYEFSTEQIRVFEAVQGKRPSPAPSKARGGSKTLPILLGAAGAVGAGVAIAAGGGDDSPPPQGAAPSPAPTTGPLAPSDVVLLGVEPPSGSSISLSAGARLLTLRVLVVAETSGEYFLGANADAPVPSPALCIGGATERFALQAGVSREQSFGVLNSSPGACPALPFTTTTLRLYLYRPPAPEPLVFRPLPLSYTWVR